MSVQSLCTALALALTLYAFQPYLRDILRGQLRPHVFSWVIWGTTTCLAFLAQLAAGGGLGAWVLGVSGGLSMSVAFLAWRHRGDIAITRLDWGFFIGALSALPLWGLTSDPWWAVVVLTTVDLLGFGPTLRKAWDRPAQESLGFFGLFMLRNLLVIAALDTRSATTVLFPGAIAAACAGVMLMILMRRAAVANTGVP